MIVRPEEAWLQPCAETLSILDAKTAEEVIWGHEEDARKYFKCADMHKALIEFERKRMGE